MHWRHCAHARRQEPPPRSLSSSQRPESGNDPDLILARKGNWTNIDLALGDYRHPPLFTHEHGCVRTVNRAINIQTSTFAERLFPSLPVRLKPATAQCGSPHYTLNTTPLSRERARRRRLVNLVNPIARMRPMRRGPRRTRVAPFARPLCLVPLCLVLLARLLSRFARLARAPGAALAGRR